MPTSYLVRIPNDSQRPGRGTSGKRQKRCGKEWRARNAAAQIIFSVTDQFYPKKLVRPDQYFPDRAFGYKTLTT